MHGMDPKYKKIKLKCSKFFIKSSLHLVVDKIDLQKAFDTFVIVYIEYRSHKNY